jgi:transcriptional regulator with XRE-family HTH domain
MDIPVLPPSEHQRDAGLRLRKLLQLLQLKQVEAARIMGVSKHVLRNWLAGDNPVQPYALYRLCRVKQVDCNYVYLGDWSALPLALAKQLEDELLSELEAKQAGEPAGVENYQHHRHD